MTECQITGASSTVNFSSKTTQLAESQFMSAVYGWMCIGLALTAIASWSVLSCEAIFYMVFGTSWGFYGLIFAELALVFGLSAYIEKMSSSIAGLFFVVYSLISGLTLSSFALIYEAGSLASAFAVTAGLFCTMCIYGTTTKKDFSSWGRWLGIGLIGIIIALLVNIFMQNSMLEFCTSCVAVVLFVALTAYDSQNIKKMSHSQELMSNSSLRARLAIIGALQLYLDFINMFIHLLRLLGTKK